VGPGDQVSGTFTQTKVVPSTATFRADVVVRGDTGEKASFGRTIEASAANMSTPGADEEHTAAQAAAGAYQGRDCLWIGCSMSFGALMAAKNGAKSVSILNHSSWAARAMQQLAAQEGLTNVRFLSEVPPPGQLRNRDICLLGAADASWQALLSHIKVRRHLDRASFLLQFCRRESPWKQFYGFDFSAYAAHDLEMYHRDKPLVDGMKFRDITPGEIIYRGVIGDESHAALNVPGGAYNCVKVGFNCGTVVLPLPELLSVGSQKGKQIQKIELFISVLEEGICRFRLMLSGSGWSLGQSYEQPLVSMGHIVRNQ
jgi:hypothetical protein